LAEVLERLGAREAGHVAQAPRIAFLPVLQAVERELVEVVAGGVVRGREAVGVVLQMPGEVGEDLEQVLVGRQGAGRVAGGRRARHRQHEQERCDGCPHAAPHSTSREKLPTRRPSAKAGALGWLRGIVLVAVMAAAGRAAADDALARLHARGTLRWGGDMQGGEPYVFQDPRDRRRLAGSLALDLLRAAPGVEVVLYEGVEEPYLDLERGRLRAVLLDNIIAARYGLPRATLRAAGTVGEGVYAIAVRPSEPELLGAVD